MLVALGTSNCCHARNLRKSASLVVELPQLGWLAFELKAGKLAMHLATRADTLHDLLANVTAFVEVERLGLAGLLREVAVADVLAVLGNALYYTPPFQGLRSHEVFGALKIDLTA